MLISAVLITLNEEQKLRDCLDSVSFADEIVVLDSGSADKTRDIATAAGAKFYYRHFDNFAAQKNAAMEKASSEWLLLIDADERISPELCHEILQTAKSADAADGYWVPRTNYVFGHRMRYGASRGDRQMRLVRRGKGQFEGVVHERINLEGRAGSLKGELRHYTTANLEEYFRRFSLYTSLEAEKIVAKGTKPSGFQIYLKPVLEFVYFYIFRLGILDGRAGLQYQLLSSFYTYVKYLKAMERLNGPGSGK